MRSASLTQPRSISAVQPSFASIEPIASNYKVWSRAFSNTIRTAF